MLFLLCVLGIFGYGAFCDHCVGIVWPWDRAGSHLG